MNFKRERKTEYYLHDTWVENLFIGEFMIGAPGDYVKVYLYGLMYAGLGAAMDNPTIARELGINEEDVMKAWTYWEEKGIITKHYPDKEDRFRYKVRFCSLKEQLFGKGKKKKPAKELPAELSDQTVKRMYNAIERITGRVFDGKEPAAILSWISDYGADPAGIVEAYRYCSTVRKNTRCAYVGTVVREWCEKGIRTPEEIQKHLAETDARHNLYRRVLKALGFTRNATEEEKRIMDIWFDQMGFDLETVLEACKKTSGISNPNINYVNSILKAWNSEGKGTAAKSAETGKKDLIKDRMARYEETRKRHAEEAEARRQEVYRTVPRVLEIEEEAHRLSLDLSRLILGGGMTSAAVQTQKNRIAALQKEKIRLLEANGFTATYMDLQYDCEKCKDTGLLEDGSRCSCFTAEGDE
ncbi:MAG: DnaD domain protein [Clostridiales bacterium]|nr:DnaD domain protein [Clostridiales bacterium]